MGKETSEGADYCFKVLGPEGTTTVHGRRLRTYGTEIGTEVKGGWEDVTIIRNRPEEAVLGNAVKVDENQLKMNL